MRDDGPEWRGTTPGLALREQLPHLQHGHTQKAAAGAVAAGAGEAAGDCNFHGPTPMQRWRVVRTGPCARAYRPLYCLSSAAPSQFGCCQSAEGRLR